MLKSPVNRGSLDDLLVFHEMARSLTSTHDINEIVRIILKYMDRFIDAELWALLVVDPRRGELYYVSPDGRDKALAQLEELARLIAPYLT